MPHRKNAKGDIGSLKRFSDTYDMDNVYLSEEGWVYRHFKNSERTLWWDEILVAGQVKPGMEIHGVNNNPVVPTNPYKLGTAWNGTDAALDDDTKFLRFEDGDGEPDYRYSNHERADDKVTTYDADKPLYDRVDFEETAWESINVDDSGTTGGNGPAEYLNPDGSQVPNGWTGVSSPKDESFTEPSYPGEKYQSINHYSVAPDTFPRPYNSQPEPWQENSEVIVGEFADGVTPATADVDHIEDPDVTPSFDMGTDAPVDDSNPIPPTPTPPAGGDPGVPVQQDE